MLKCFPLDNNQNYTEQDVQYLIIGQLMLHDDLCLKKKVFYHSNRNCGGNIRQATVAWWTPDLDFSMRHQLIDDMHTVCLDDDICQVSIFSDSE